MDGHVFRRLGDILTSLLPEAILEKIRSPAEDVFVFSFYTRPRKLHLVLKQGRQHPFLFLADSGQAMGRPPDARVMRLRKYCANRRVRACVADWQARRLLLQFSTDTKAGEIWLDLHLREGPRLIQHSLNDLSPEPLWPAEKDWERLTTEQERRRWPVLTPALRRTLTHYSLQDQQALLVDLEMGGGDLFVYTPLPGNADPTAKLPELTAWPLPAALRKGRQETIFDDPLAAVSVVGRALVLENMAHTAQQQAALPYRREVQRLERLLTKMDTEEVRLRGMAEAQQTGLALQAQLWRFAPDWKGHQLLLPDTDGTAAPKAVPLDARLTLRENMAVLFHTAARGRRGLTHLQQRREQIRRDLDKTRQAMTAVLAGAPLPEPVRQRALSPADTLPKGVQLFVSSDGFAILRGRDARGNWSALRAAAPHDLWLHVEGGPGSHCIIRRAFAGQKIPERTLQEAGGLAAMKSWQRDNSSAHLLCAEVRYVKPLRGAAPGTVRIDKVAITFHVALDLSLEKQLAPAPE